MSEPVNPEAQDHDFREITGPDVRPVQHLSIDDLKRVRLSLSADLGTTTMLVRDVLELRRGSVIQLDKLAGEMTDLYVNNLHLARGEVVVIGDMLHVRIGEITGGDDEEKQTDEDA
jgi:flagellar motor switch protein FliN